VIAATLEPIGIAGSFALALGVVVVVQAVELRSALRAHPSAQDAGELTLEIAE
jgi:hypothetical protein